MSISLFFQQDLNRKLERKTVFVQSYFGDSRNIKKVFLNSTQLTEQRVLYSYSVVFSLSHRVARSKISKCYDPLFLNPMAFHRIHMKQGPCLGSAFKNYSIMPNLM